jgi:hypothetical protein
MDNSYIIDIMKNPEYKEFLNNCFSALGMELNFGPLQTFKKIPVNC